MKLVNKNQNIEMSSKSFLSSNTKTSFNISAANSSKSSFINTFIGGIPHSKSSSNVNSISGNVYVTIYNTYIKYRKTLIIFIRVNE